jgi:hypothetical protein
VAYLERRFEASAHQRYAEWFSQKANRSVAWNMRQKYVCTALYSENELLDDETIWTVVMLLSPKGWIGKRAVNLKGTPCGVIKIIETYRTKRPIDDCKAGDCHLLNNMHHLHSLLDAIDRPRQQI